MYEKDITQRVLAAFAAFNRGVEISAICPLCGKTLVVEQAGKTWTVKCPRNCIKEVFRGL